MEQALLCAVVTKMGEALALEALKAATRPKQQQDELHLILLQTKSSMQRIKSEFEVMQAFLKTMDRENDEVTEAWLKRVREVASQAQKITDDFMMIVRGSSKSLGRVLFETFRYNSWKPLKIYIKEQESMSEGCYYKEEAPNNVDWHKLATQLKQVEEDFDHIMKMKIRWEITTRSSSTNSR